VLPSASTPSTSAPTPATSARPTLPPIADAISIFVRRPADPSSGVDVYAVGPDGTETLIRNVPDTVVPGGRLGEWGSVSPTGWLALSSEVNPWPMVLVDLRDPSAEPWIVTQANTGGIGPRWGPNGLVAADASGNGGQVVVADPETREARLLSMRGGLIGGGPSIVWTADGTGIAASTGTGSYQVVPIDGGEPRPVEGELFDVRSGYGPGLSEVRVCVKDDLQCGGIDGQIERIDPDGSRHQVFMPQGANRPLAAGFGGGPDEYWIAMDQANGTQVSFVRITGESADVVATINRDRGWQYVGAPEEAPDRTALVTWIVAGDTGSAVVVPMDGRPATFHPGHFSGFVERSGISGQLAGGLATPGQTLPPVGEPYALPSVDELIAAELALNPGERVLGKDSHDAVPGDTTTRTTEIRRDVFGGSVYLDCFGPASVTVTTGAGSATNPCTAAGSYIIQTGTSAPVTVTARGDTSWRVVIYLEASQSDGATPPPAPG
jgi:hypothetical protein